MKKKPKKTYKWAHGRRISFPASIAIPELERIAEKSGRKITAEDVLKDAKPKESLLHAAFEWDDTEAAHQYRLEQARLLIRSVRVVVGEKEEVEIRLFYNVQDADEGSAYYPAVRVLNEKELHQKALAQACKLLYGVLAQYDQLSELKTVRKALERVQKKFL